MSTTGQSSGGAAKLHRAHNFNAGPAVLPLEVLQQVQAEFLDY